MSTGDARNQGSHTVTIIAALIGALATVVAALIAVFPSLRSSGPGPQPPIIKENGETPPPPPPPPTPTMKDCVGLWRWRTDDRFLDFDLNADGSMKVRNHPDKASDFQDGAGFVRDGKGHWEVEDGRITVTMTHVWVGVFWKEFEGVWLSKEPIEAVRPDEIRLRNKKPLRRRDGG
jgi:hypothetical protein